MNNLFNVLKYILYIILFVVLFNLFYSTLSIINNELVYCKEIGWIDMNHSLPSGPLKLMKQVENLNNAKSNFKQISYVQEQSKLGYHMEAGALFQFEKDSLNSSDTYFIFNFVSKYFEQKQQEQIFFHSRLRSLGDLNGNEIAFFCSMNNISLEDFSKELNFYSKTDTILELLKSAITLEDDKNTFKINIFYSLNNNYKVNRENDKCKKVEKIFLVDYF